MKPTINGTAHCIGKGPAADVLAKLEASVDELEQQQAELLQAHVAHLGELAALGRACDGVAQGRGFAQIARETLAEASRLVGLETMWLVEPDPTGQPRAVYATGQAEPEAPDVLPSEARELYARVAGRRVERWEGTGAVASERETYLAMAIRSGRHLVGALIFERPGGGQAYGEHVVRLLDPLLSQMGVACENSRLVDTMGQLVLDVVGALTAAIESRDPYTGGHTQRVTSYALLLGRRLELGSTELAILQLGGLLHDIGKVAVPDAVLRKPGRLTEEEYRLIQSHPVVGHQIVSLVPHLHVVNDIVRHHHERWDGRGYPDGLAGDRIPLLARVVSVVDAFDAMTDDRPYRRGMPLEMGLAEIEANAGTQFDPELARLFTSCPVEELMEAGRGVELGPEGSVSHADLVEMINLHLPRLNGADAEAGERGPEWRDGVAELSSGRIELAPLALAGGCGPVLRLGRGIGR